MHKGLGATPIRNPALAYGQKRDRQPCPRLHGTPLTVYAGLQ